ncbi:ATP-binding protein [Herbaspirillum rhizosphaerae]|uniref:ATP-binding protein n=1 Tax=Herbaspirillum rhizosphaerae TaxID=346179 RepID=UPI00067CEE22|nr:ATP-binding protein [Herbaspirillum rhizosphaerae]
MSKSRALSLDNTPIPAAGDAELRFRITDYSYAPISETGAVAYLRAWRQNARPDAHAHPLTIARAKSDTQAAEAARQLRNELALCAAIDDAWALKPTGSVVGAGAVVLLYDDADILSLDKVAPHALTTACFIKLAPKLARVMESMHANGLVHRNVNPSCFFIGIDTAVDEAAHFRVKIGGFGLAATVAEMSGDDDAAAALLCGELAYMSPEHSGRTQRAIDARSDLYSLGVIFYRLLTGHLPFGISGVDSDAAEWIHFHIASEAVAPHLLSDTIPPMLSNIVMRLLEKNPDRRYQDATQLHADLEYCQHALSAESKDGGAVRGDITAAPPLPVPATLHSLLHSTEHASPSITSAAVHARNRMQEAVLHYHAGEYAQAGTCMALIEEPELLSELHAEFHFFSALILAAGDAPPAQKEQRRHALTQHCEKIFFPSVASTPVLSVQTTVLLGEIARLNADPGTAQRHYEQAASRAEENQLWHYAGISHELAARVCQEQSLPTSLLAHLKSARRAYRKFDAPELAEQLARRFPEAMASLPRSQDAAPLSETANIRDLESVIRAARALSEEIRLDELMQTIMSVTLEHVGAERGLLIRLDEQLAYIDACARTTTSGIAVTLGHTPATENDMPMAMLHQALNTGHQVYAGDDGVLQTFQSGLNSRSHQTGGPAPAARFNAICVPMLKQARVVGALYLENRVLPDAFTVEHTQILQLLASQAAISLETARLYAALLAENAQRKTAEKALRSSQTSLIQGEQFNHIGSMRYVLEEGLMYCSAELCRIYELEAGKDVITYEEFSALLHPDDRHGVLDTVEAAVAVGGVIRVEHRICRKSGEVRYISGIGKPFYVDGKFTEYVGTATDITSRRQAEDALRVAQADLARVSRATTVGQLTASIAHEINQPLMSIVSNAGASLRWLDRTPMHLENARAGLRDIVAEGQRAGDMIQSLQRLTRNTEAVFERINLNAAIRHILAISRSEIERHGISLVLNLTQENLYAMGDFVQIQQVLLNLVINAIEAMAEIATRTRILSISSANADGAFIRVIIADTGEGIAADAAERVFEAFYTTKKNGMGMGLAICRSIIETHRGRLQAAVRQPFGSTFSFELPLAQ